MLVNVQSVIIRSNRNYRILMYPFSTSGIHGSMTQAVVKVDSVWNKEYPINLAY